MNLHRGAVQRADLYLDRNDLHRLHGREHTRQNPLPGPAAHPSIDRVPMAVLLGQPPPLGTILRNVENGVEDFQITVGQATAMLGEAVGDAFIVLLCQVHHLSYQAPAPDARFTLTGPSQIIMESIDRGNIIVANAVLVP